MGLDLYLVKRTHVKNWSHQESPKYLVEVKKDGAPHPTIKSDRITDVEEEVMYWRKANQIHNWFVKNVQGGKDDCETYDVSRGDLKMLLSDCEKVLEASKLIKGKIQNGFMNGEPVMEDGEYIEDPTVAQQLLPTTQGFFFGSTDYDEWYYKDVKDTRDMLVELLKDDPNSDWDTTYQYSSSW